MFPPHRVTNGGKTTLTNRLIKNLPNCCVVHQDDFFKVSIIRKIDHIRGQVFSGGGGGAQCSGVHLIGVCFSPKMRLKLGKMALSSMMVSRALMQGLVRVFLHVCRVLALTFARFLRSHQRSGHGRHDEHHPRLAAEPRQVRAIPRRQQHAGFGDPSTHSG